MKIIFIAQFLLLCLLGLISACDHHLESEFGLAVMKALTTSAIYPKFIGKVIKCAENIEIPKHEELVYFPLHFLGKHKELALGYIVDYNYLCGREKGIDQWMITGTGWRITVERYGDGTLVEARLYANGEHVKAYTNDPENAFSKVHCKKRV